MAGQARGTGGNDSSPFKQEIMVKQLEVQCEDTKQTIDKLPPPFIYYRSEHLQFLGGVLDFEFYSLLATCRSDCVCQFH